jgi:hypothetical protein
MVSTCGVCGHEGRHVHRCAACDEPVTVKAADWIVRQPVNADGSLAELRVEHSPAAAGCPSPGTRPRI